MGDLREEIEKEINSWVHSKKHRKHSIHLTLDDLCRVEPGGCPYALNTLRDIRKARYLLDELEKIMKVEGSKNGELV